MKRTAYAEWQSGFRTGHGTFTIEGGSLVNVSFSFQGRYQSENGMSPEGLLAAAHAASFSMAFARQLEEIGMEAERIDTVATVTVEDVHDVRTITQVDLELNVRIASTNHRQVQSAAERAQSDCTVSRLINAKVTLKTKIEGQSPRAVA